MSNTSDKRQTYEQIYDNLCDFLDREFRENNYCNFKNGKCYVNRSGIEPNRTYGNKKSCGCCWSFNYNDLTGGVDNLDVCEHLTENGCGTKNLSCKLFTCQYLRNKGVQYSLFDIPDLNLVFNKKQLLVLEQNFFKTREQIIDKLISTSRLPIPFYIFKYLRLYKIH